MRRALFGDTGYGLDVLGAETSVQNSRPPTCSAFHQTFARPNNCVLAIYGDINPGEVRAAVTKPSATWQPAPPPRTLALQPSALWPRFSASPKPATRSKPSWSSVSAARRCTTPTATRSNWSRKPAATSAHASSCAFGKNWAWPTMSARRTSSDSRPATSPFTPAPPPSMPAGGKGTPRRSRLASPRGAYARRTPARQGQSHRPTENRPAGPWQFRHDHRPGRTLWPRLRPHRHRRRPFQAVTLDQVKAVAQKYLTPDALVIALVRPEPH